MNTIHKYSLAGMRAGRCALTMVRDATILSIQCQRGEPMLWALVDDRKPEEKREVVVVGTGWDLSDEPLGEYLGTYQEADTFVWHVFALLPSTGAEHD